MGENKKPRNPQAFPFVIDETKPNLVEAGMTLRDYFAAKAMHGIMVGDITSSHHPITVSSWAYSVADAMLKEREK